MIYFMQSENGGYIKIGYTINLESRKKALETHYGQKLVVLATMEGMRKREREIHLLFARLRHQFKEQFKPGDELMDFIGIPRLSVDSLASAEPMEAAIRPFKPVYHPGSDVNSDPNKNPWMTGREAREFLGFSRDQMWRMLKWQNVRTRAMAGVQKRYWREDIVALNTPKEVEQ